MQFISVGKDETKEATIRTRAADQARSLVDDLQLQIAVGEQAESEELNQAVLKNIFEQIDSIEQQCIESLFGKLQPRVREWKSCAHTASCPGEESNLHVHYGHMNLNHARLPIPPPGLGGKCSEVQTPQSLRSKTLGAENATHARQRRQPAGSKNLTVLQMGSPSAAFPNVIGRQWTRLHPIFPSIPVSWRQSAVDCRRDGHRVAIGQGWLPASGCWRPACIRSEWRCRFQPR